jgi:hypothetical protein
VATAFLPFEQIAYVFNPRQFARLSSRAERDGPACDAPGATTVVRLQLGRGPRIAKISQINFATKQFVFRWSRAE